LKSKNPQHRGLKPFPKGVSGNPGGKPRIPEELRGIKLLPKHVAAILWSKWLSMDAEELKSQAQNWQLSALELAMCRAILSDITNGEMKNIEIGLSRIVGKLGEAPPVDDTEGLNGLSHEELMGRVKKALKVLELTKKTDGAFEEKE